MWQVITSNPRKTALFFALFCACIYVVSYLIVAHSAAVEVARDYALEKRLVSGDTRVGFIGFRIRIVGQEGEASFRLIDSTSHQSVRFRVEKSSGQWKVAVANPE